MTRDRHFADRIGALALLDPEARSTAAVIAGDHVCAGADQVGDIEAFVDILDQVFGAELTCFEMQIGRRRGRRR